TFYPGAASPKETLKPPNQAAEWSPSPAYPTTRADRTKARAASASKRRSPPRSATKWWHRKRHRTCYECSRVVLHSCKARPERPHVRDIAAAPSNGGLSAVMQSCSECLVFMVETLRLARDSKVMRRVNNA